MMALFKLAVGGWKTWAIAAAVVVAVAIGAYVKGRVDGASICDGRLATAAAEYAEARDKAVAAAEARRVAVARHFVEIDARYTKEQSDAKLALDALRRDVAAGRRQLRVAAQCPAAPGVPAAAGSTGLGATASARLEGPAEQDYYTLVDRLALMEAQLRVAQEALLKERSP